MQKSSKTKTPFNPYRTTIKSVKQETSDIKTYTMSFLDEDASENFSHKPGQFNMLSIPGVGECAASISSPPNGNGEFNHTVRAAGRVTGKLATFDSGATVGIRGPYGRPWPMEQLKDNNVIIVAGGIGFAPLRPVIAQIHANRQLYRNVEILYGTKKVEDILYGDEFGGWQKNYIDMLLTVDKGSKSEWPYHVGVVTTLFDRLKSGPSDSIALLCGPEVMMQFCVIELLRSGFSEEQIYISLERRMDCGIRMCGHCMLGPKFVCQDGPVFQYSEVKGLFGYVY